jgi:predicted CopG family antitoxin
MRTLIQNYTSALSTEPMYIHRCLSECGYETSLWSDPQMSAYDTFDMYQPNLFITHYKFLTNDIVKYLSKKKQIKMVLNISGASQSEIDVIENIAKAKNVNIPFMFTNLYESNNNVKTKNIKCINLYPAADIFLAPAPTPDYNLQACVISIQKNDLAERAIENKETYHTLSLNPESSDYADMSLDVAGLSSFYHKYDEVILADDVNLVTSQILFDSILKSKKVTLRVPENQQKLLDSILASLFIEDNSKSDISDLIRGQIKRKHNCFKRTARLFRALKIEDVSQKLEGISDKL